MELADKSCRACDAKTPALIEAERDILLKQLNGWQVLEGKFLIKKFPLKNFADALALANDIGELAERVGHHPDLLVRWGELSIKIWTHAADNLTESDFVLAAKIDRLTRKR